MKRLLLIIIIVTMYAAPGFAQTLVHYWNFNLTTTEQDHLAPSYTAGVAVKPNAIEDLSDNAIADVQSATFTTIASQTIFNPGDLLFVAYQMNAVPNEDRIAFVTFVNILPGTIIHFTDAKYTSNSPAQCPGGLDWTAPAAGVSAGTVVVINNDAGTASTGTITGNTFGLSANGDQVIAYTGTNTLPNFITALSSNEWLATNTSCSGSNSMRPASLTDGVNAINLSTAPGNTAGNTVNAYYAGPMNGTIATLKSLITNPANWTGTANATPAQTWPTWAFPGSPVVNKPTIAFNTQVLSVAENAGQVSVQLNLANPAAATVKLVVKAAPFSTAGAADFTLTTQTLTFTGASTTTQIIDIPIVDDGDNEQDEYFVLSLEDPSGLTVTGSTFMTVYLRDNDRSAPVPNKQIELSYLGSYDPSGSSNASSEIVVYDSATRRLFVISAIQNRLDIADFSNPAAIQPVRSIDMIPYGGITSVAVRNGIVATAVPNANQQLNGSVVFFNTDGVFLNRVTVGALPDMITFTPDGSKVMTANEGQPNDSYTVDPEGSVSIIDVTGGIAGLTQSHVTTLDFTAFNAQTAALLAAGVRKGFPGSTLSQDLEPEYISFAPDSKTAWVILQEANAFAVIDIDAKKVTDLWPLGKKDHSLMGNGFDASDRGTNAHIANWPVKGLYMPDGIGTYTVNGATYLVGANEGDDREYSAFNERVRVNDASYVLDPAAFPNAAVLKNDNNLGRLRVTKASGDTDGDGDFDEIHLIGARSFSIWNMATKALVYDSKDDFEQYLSKTPLYAPIFNADHESNTLKSRSTSKGAEPEGLALANIEGKQYAFVSLERQGGVMTYDITDPTAPTFVDYNNPRKLSSYGGDNGPEGITYISNLVSPDGKHYIVVANEISGSLSIYRILNTTNCTPVTITKEPVAPAPVNNGSGVATFQVETSGGTPVTYRWQENGVNITNGGVYSGANTATLTITDAGLSLNGKQYRVYVTNCLGNNSDTSNAATLSVKTTPAVKVSDVIVNENAGRATIQFCLSAVTNKPVTIWYHTTNGSAYGLLDYLPAIGSRTIPAGQSCASISVNIVDLPFPEPTEEFFVNISSVTNAVIGDKQGKVTILDNDHSPTITISDVTVNEDAGQAVLNVCLSAPTHRTVSVLYNTANGSATAGADYGLRIGLLIIPAGQTCATIKVPIINNKTPEQTEEFYVNLNLPLNGSIADGQAKVVIIDNDPRVGGNGPKEGSALHSKIMITPNPFGNRITASVPSSLEEKATLTLYDLSGRQWLTRTVNLISGHNQVVLEGMERLAPGTYFLQITTGTRKEVEKLIKKDW